MDLRLCFRICKKPVFSEQRHNLMTIENSSMGTVSTLAQNHAFESLLSLKTNHSTNDYTCTVNNCMF